MRYRLLFPALVSAAFVCSGCHDQDPFSPSAREDLVFARAEATSVAATAELGIVRPGEFIFTDGVLHIRDVGFAGPMAGEIVGTAAVAVDADVVLATGKGPSRASGTIEISELDGQAVTGSWEIRMTGMLQDYPGPNFIHAGHVVGHGVGGELAGTKIKGTYTNEANPGVNIFRVTVRVLDPNEK